MVEKGDRITVESEKVGVEPRSGVVTDTNGTALQVHWDDGHDSTFVPAAGALRVEDRRPAAGPTI